MKYTPEVLIRIKGSVNQKQRYFKKDAVSNMVDDNLKPTLFHFSGEIIHSFHSF